MGTIRAHYGALLVFTVVLEKCTSARTATIKKKVTAPILPAPSFLDTYYISTTLHYCNGCNAVGYPRPLWHGSAGSESGTSGSAEAAERFAGPSRCCLPK